MFVLFVYYTNNNLLVPGSCRANTKKWLQYSMDLAEDTLENGCNESCFYSF